MSLLKDHYESKRIAEFKGALPDQIWSAMIWGKGALDAPRWDRAQVINEAYEKNAVFFAAVNTIVNAISSMPLYVEVEVRGKKQRVDAHPILRVLERNEPYRQFIRRYANYYVALGTTYAKIVKDHTDRKPLGVIVMPAQFVRNIQGTYMKPIKGYKYIETNEQDIAVEDVIHAYAPSMSRYWEEMSPAIPLAEVISLHNAAIKWNKNIAQKGGIPAMIAEVMTRSKTEISKFKEWWQEQLGADRAHELKVVGEGTKFHNTAFRPNDTEWNNALLTTMRMIFMTLGVSSSIMNDAANKTYNNVHDARKALYEEGAIPILEILLGAITSKLQPFYADNPVIRIDRAKVEPIQEDRKMAIDRLVKAVDAGIMTANEARTELGLQPAKGATADLLQNSRIINNIPKVDVNGNGGSDNVDNPNDEEPENAQ
jgi:HK97 family phage portal protein